ncbi:MAG: IS66 family transposase [Clostridia bacterium]|nr:IS66 family transposase [Clostridia bacterium]
MTPTNVQLKEENATLRALLLASQEVIATREKELQALITAHEKERQALLGRIDKLSESVEHLTRKLYGSSSEKLPMHGQLVMDEVARLFNEVEMVEEEELSEAYTAPKRRKTKKGHKLTDVFGALQPVDVIHRLSDEERCCTTCGHELSVLGIRHNRFEVEFIPAKVNLLDIQQETCTCPNCSKERGETVFVEPHVPEPVIQHSYASPSSVAHVMYQKYVQALPLDRQVKDWKAMGVTLDRGTLSSWVNKATHEWLLPLMVEFKQKLDVEPVLHADETPVQVLREPDRPNEAKSYMWVLANGSEAHHPIRYFEYGPGRGQSVAERLLLDFKGYLVTDDYSGYNRLPHATRCSCWAHVRRKFEAVSRLKREKGTTGIADRALRFIGDLFMLERTLSVMTADARREARLKEAVPLLQDFWSFVEENAPQVLPRTMLGNAFQYAINNRSRLMTFLEDGRIPITNERAENAIRPFAVGRKNWLFAGSPTGAITSACVYSLVETAKANALDPFLYLRTLFEEIPGSDYRSNSDTMERLMPWSDFMQARCAANAPR